MPERSSKRPKRSKDANRRAWQVVQEATGQSVPAPTASTRTPAQEAAAILGRLGGLKGGKARAKSLTKKERSEISRRAAEARWKAKRGP